MVANQALAEKAGQTPHAGPEKTIGLEGLARLLSILQQRGYTAVGPTVHGPAIVYGRIETLADLPAGRTAQLEAGRYRLAARDDQALFGYVVGPTSLKRFLHPPDLKFIEVHKTGENGAFRVVEQTAATPRYAFFGIRACDLAALAIRDRVLLEDRYVDASYAIRRQGIFTLAVDCAEPAPTCFCASMGGGPSAESGYDLALTEVLSADRHVFRLRAGTELGAALLGELEAVKALKAPPPVVKWKRAVNRDGLKERLYAAFDNPRFDQVAQRCLSCANCTMVCPTCFCVTVEDTSDLPGQTAMRTRRWDSCFTQSFSYIHGGSVRLSAKSRYRQWLTHKLASWQDQFGIPGCVGCGRCITWCPVGIDITEEAAALEGEKRNGN